MTARKTRSQSTNLIPHPMAFQCIVADPPWRFNDKLPGDKRGAASHYRTLALDQISMLQPYADLAREADDAVLFLWRVAAMQREALEVCRAWLFEPKTEIVWCKLTRRGNPHFGMGRYVRNAHETCLVATRGRPKILSHSIRSTFSARVGEHSDKPDEFYLLVEQLCVGPRLDMFARRNRLGWTCMGNQLPRRAS